MKHTRHVSRTPQLIKAESLLVIRQQIAALDDFVLTVLDMVTTASSWLSFFRDLTGKGEDQ